MTVASSNFNVSNAPEQSNVVIPMLGHTITGLFAQACVLVKPDGTIITRDVAAEYTQFTNVNTTYDNVVTTETSDGVDCAAYRYCSVGGTLAKNATPTKLTITLEASLDGSNYIPVSQGPAGLWVFNDTIIGSGISKMLTLPIAAQLVRLTVTAVGTTATNTFTLSNWGIYLRD